MMIRMISHSASVFGFRRPTSSTLFKSCLQPIFWRYWRATLSTRLGPCSLNCLLAMISIRHWESRSWQASHSSFLGLRPSLPILRVILAFSVVSLLFRSLLSSLLCRYCFPMVSFQSRSLSSHDRRVALLWHLGDGRLLGNPWDRTGTSQEARSIDFSNFLVGARRYPLAALWFALRFLLIFFLPRCFYPSRDLTIKSLLCFALLLCEQKKPKNHTFV